MSSQTYLEAAPIHELTRYAGRGDYENEGVAFSGTARKHPYDKQKLLLVSPPFVSRRIIYEFRLSDIIHAENTSNLVSENGESLPTVTIWIRKGSFGVVMKPFEVGTDTQDEMQNVQQKSNARPPEFTPFESNAH